MRYDEATLISTQQVSSRDDMAITEGRFNKLEARVNEIGERLAKIEGGSSSQPHRSEWKAWIPIGAPVVALIAVLLGMGYHFDGKVGEVRKDLGALSDRTRKVEDAVKVLGDSQKTSIQTIIHDLLSAAEAEKDFRSATRAVQTAANLTDTLKKEKHAAASDFFNNTVATIRSLEQKTNQPELKQASFQAQQRLAEYRSALEVAAQNGKFTISCPPGAKFNSAIGMNEGAHNLGISNMMC